MRGRCRCRGSRLRDLQRRGEGLGAQALLWTRREPLWHPDPRRPGKPHTVFLEYGVQGPTLFWFRHEGGLLLLPFCSSCCGLAHPHPLALPEPEHPLPEPRALCLPGSLP